MFKDNDPFVQKWKAILNKCSSDLMLLIMEQSMQIASTNEKEIEEMKNELQNDHDLDTYNNKLKKIMRK